MLSQIYLLLLVSGATSELLIFSRGEWDRYAPKIVAFFTTVFWAIFGLLHFQERISLLQSYMMAILIAITYAIGLFTAMLTYRLFFHPLRSFPGPLGARISAFWAFKRNFPDLKLYRKLQNLHAKYGDFVRIRPREISICHPDAVADTHGHKNKIRKGEFYEQIFPEQSLQLTRDPALHKSKRRYWDKAFQPKALHEYEPRLEKHCRILMDILYRHASSQMPINISKTFEQLGFDIVSELMFGRSFDILSNGKIHGLVATNNRSKKPSGLLITMIWLLHLMRAFPRVGGRKLYGNNFYIRAHERREQMDVSSPDFYTYFSQAEGFTTKSTNDAKLAMAAGADTVAIALSNACYLLCQLPEYMAKLQSEVDDLPTVDGIISNKHLIDKPYLAGIINETMRLYPPVPSNLHRLTPPEGATIAGRYIPGNTIVTTPTYSIQRDPRAFVDPDKFVPERWFAKPEMILRKDAFFPFSYGTYNCAGKPLALMELRMVLAMVFRRFDMAFPDDREECYNYIDDQQDCFILKIGKLSVVVRERSRLK